MPSNDVIRFECPRCLAEVRVEIARAGTRIDCPSCKQSLLAPDANAAGDGLFDDIFDDANLEMELPADIGGDDENPVADDLDLEGLTIAGPSEPAPGDELSKHSLAESSLQPGHESFEVEPGDPLELPDLEPLDDVVEADAGGDPFAEQPDDQPLHIEGISPEKNTLDSVFGVVCKICDTRIHVAKDQIGEQVECPICYSKVDVIAPERKVKPRPVWETPSQAPPGESVAPDDGNELKLAPLETFVEPETVEAAETAAAVDEGVGLPEIEEDLLKPIVPRPEPESDQEEIEVIDVVDGSEPASPAVSDAERKLLEQPWDDVFGKANPEEPPESEATTETDPVKSNDDPGDSELPSQSLLDEIPDLEVVSDPQSADEHDIGFNLEGIELEEEAPVAPDDLGPAEDHPLVKGQTGFVPPQPIPADPADEPGEPNDSVAKSRREKFERSQLDSEQAHDNLDSGLAADEIEPYEFYQFVERTMEMFKSPGCWVGLLVSALLLGLGNTIYLYFEWADMKEWSEGAKMGARAVQLSGFGLFWAAGWTTLFYVSGLVFREAAAGNRAVNDWKISSVQELRDTTLLFAISYIAAGLPLAIFNNIISNTIGQLLFASPLLLAAWYNQSPYKIFAPAIFKNIGQDRGDWQMFGGYVILLVVIGVIAASLYFVPLAIPVSFLAAGLHVGVIVSFATVSGWHAARTVAKLGV